jgi:hypothetical protein
MNTTIGGDRNCRDKKFENLSSNIFGDDSA